MAASWKKIILENDDAALASITASAGVNLTLTGGDNTQNVLTIDTDGNVHSILQSSVDGTDTTYDAGNGLALSVGGSPNTFSVVPGEISHDDLADHNPLEHILWGSSQTSGGYVIDPANYTNNTYTNGTGIDIAGADESFTLSTSPTQSHVLQVGALQAGSIVDGFGAIYTSGNIWTSGTLSGSTVQSGGQLKVSGNATVDGTLTATNVTASNVGITGSLTVDGSLIFNGETFANVIADTMTGSTSWGDDDGTSNHYFTGSITASGTISASSFLGSGAGLTGIDTGQLSLSSLGAGDGLAFSGGAGPYNGGSALSLGIKSDTSNGVTITAGGSGLRIADQGVDTAQIKDGAVTTLKIAAGAVTTGKLADNLIVNMSSATSVSGSDELLVSIGEGGSETLRALTIANLATYVDSQMGYTNNTGSVTSVNATQTVPGLTLQVPANSTTTPVVTLGGSISIDNNNWQAGTALSTGNGGTGATSPSAAAAALLTQTLGSFTLGDANSTITIPGDLLVTGTTTTINSTNLEITDRFILIGSGSTDTDVGISFGSNASQANMLFWDSDYDSSTGRFGLAKNVQTEVGDGMEYDLTAEYHLASVYNGTTSEADSDNADQFGNIVIADDGAAYIYA